MKRKVKMNYCNYYSKSVCSVNQIPISLWASIALFKWIFYLFLLFGCVPFRVTVRSVGLFQHWLPCSVIFLAPTLQCWQTYSIFPACITFSIFYCLLNYLLLFSRFLCYHIHEEYFFPGYCFCGEFIIPYFEVTSLFLGVTSF